MLIIRKFIGFVFVLTGFVCSQNSDGIKSLSHTIKIYYANVFNIQSNDIKLKFIHVPEIDLDREYSVIPTRKKKLGHQTIWIEEKDTEAQKIIDMQNDLNSNMNSADFQSKHKMTKEMAMKKYGLTQK